MQSHKPESNERPRPSLRRVQFAPVCKTPLQPHLRWKPNQSNKSVEFLCATLRPPIPVIHTLRLQIQKLQACLKWSFSSTLHFYGHATALLTELGIPLLQITQNLQLAQFRYRLSTNKNNIISHTLYVREQHTRAIMHDDTMGRRMHKAICQVGRDRIDPHTTRQRQNWPSAQTQFCLCLPYIHIYV